MTACGPCMSCCYGPERYVQVFADDLAAIGPERARRLVVATIRPPEPNPDRPPEPDLFMRMVNGHCAALDPSVPERQCTIYEDRPLICRALAVSSSSCREARAQYPVGASPRP